MFAEHIRNSGVSRGEWAARLGVSKSYLSELEHGKKRPSLEIAVEIERLTEGAVPAASWVPEPKEAAE